MKKLLKFMLATVMVSTVAISCSKDEPAPTPDGGTTGSYPYPTIVEAKTGEGVTLKVSNISEKNFTITTTMGIDAKSYRFDILPLAKYYNQWIEGGKDMSEEEWILKRLFNNGGESGFTFNKPIDVTWGGSIYNAAAIIPGVDYIVLACGALHENGTGYGEITKMKVALTKKAVEGNPIANILPDPTFQYITFNFTMNEDCYGYYYLAPETKEITNYMEFVKSKGEDEETLLHDVVCTFLKEPFTAPTSFKKDFGFNASPDISMTALTVGLDANGTLAKTITRKDANITEKPNVPAAEYDVKFTVQSARSFFTEWTANWDVTYAVYHRYETLPGLASLMSQYARNQIAQVLAYQGWGHNQNNKKVHIEGELSPETTYVLITTARNKGLDLLDIRLDTVKTKKLIKNERDQSLAKVSQTILDITKTDVTLAYNLPEGTTYAYERILEDGSKDYDTGVDLTDPANEDFLISWLESGENGNVQYFDGPAKWNWNQLTPGMTYHAFIVAEDINGRMGPLSKLTFTTPTNTGGPNPKMELKQHIEYSEYDGTQHWYVTFTPNSDVTMHRSAIANNDDIDGIADATDAEKEKLWNDWVINNNNTAEKLIQSEGHKPVTKYSNLTALSISYGGMVDGKRAQGPLQILHFEPSMLQSTMLAVKPFQTMESATKAAVVSKNDHKVIRHSSYK